MISKSRFRMLLPSAAPAYQHILRKAADLMENGGLTPHALVDLGPEERERRLRALQVPHAVSVARRIPAALTYLDRKFPGENLPVTAPELTGRHALPRRREEPRQFRLDMVAGYRALAQRRADEANDAHQPCTDRTNVRSCREYWAAVARAGIEMDDEFGLEAATCEPVALATLDRLRRDYALTTVQKILGGVIAVSALVLTPDHPHVGWLGTQRGAKNGQPGRALSHKTETKLAAIMSTGGVQRLLAVPDLIEGSASARGLARKDEIARLQHAFLLGLKFDHPGMTERQAATLHLVRDIDKIADRQCLKLWPTSKSSSFVAEPLSEQSKRRLQLLLKNKQRTGLTSPYLFPSREENFCAAPRGGDETVRSGRRTSVVLSALYQEIYRHTGFKLVFMDLKDLIVKVLLESGIEPFIVARRAGYRHVRSMETRMRAHFQAAAAS